MRRGMAALIARFEPDRFRSVDRLLSTFGARETLGGMRVREPKVRPVRIAPAVAGSVAVH